MWVVEHKDVMWERKKLYNFRLSRQEYKKYILQICMENHKNKHTWNTIKQVDTILTIMFGCMQFARGVMWQKPPDNIQFW